MHQVAIDLRVHRDGPDAEFPAGAQDAQRDLAPVRNDNFLEHKWRSCAGAVAGGQTILNSGWSNSTGWPSSTRIALILPALSDSMWFIIFIASMMQITSPAFTLWPTSTKALAPGEGER